MSSRQLPQATDAPKAASDSPSLAKRSPKSKARKLPASSSAATAKRVVGETRLSEIVSVIVRELRPHRRPEKDVQESVRNFIEPLLKEVAELKRRLGVRERSEKDYRELMRRIGESLPPELAQTKAMLTNAKWQGKIKESPADALKHLKKLGKCAAELRTLLLNMPSRIAWVRDMGGGLSGTSYPTTPETRILIPVPVEHPMQKFMNFMSDLGRLQTAAKIAEGYVGPSPLYQVEKHLSAKSARFLVIALSKEPPTSTGPFHTIAGLLFEVITGKKDVDLERHCKAELRAAAEKARLLIQQAEAFDQLLL
jgi:hypothetical protein